MMWRYWRYDTRNHMGADHARINHRVCGGLFVLSGEAMSAGAWFKAATCQKPTPERQAELTQQRIAELERENAELRKDSERLDYMQRTQSTVEILLTSEPYQFRIGGVLKSHNSSIRAAIDAAKETT